MKCDIGQRLIYSKIRGVYEARMSKWTFQLLHTKLSSLN